MRQQCANKILLTSTMGFLDSRSVEWTAVELVDWESVDSVEGGPLTVVELTWSSLLGMKWRVVALFDLSG